MEYRFNIMRGHHRALCGHLRSRFSTKQTTQKHVIECIKSSLSPKQGDIQASHGNIEPSKHSNKKNREKKNPNSKAIFEPCLSALKIKLTPNITLNTRPLDSSLHISHSWLLLFTLTCLVFDKNF